MGGGNKWICEPWTVSLSLLMSLSLREVPRATAWFQRWRKESCARNTGWELRNEEPGSIFETFDWTGSVASYCFKFSLNLFPSFTLPSCNLRGRHIDVV